MDLTPHELEELQEKLILVYRFLSQNKTFKKFYYKGIEVNEPIKDDKGFLKKLMELDDSEELLKSCIIELEDMKSGSASMTPVGFQEFMLQQDWNALYKKYDMKTLEDVGKLDLEMLLDIF
ncbi:MAG: hypothetical protein HVN35_07030 [Methanobacteriaceae archaeon]|nr:hypothetical protein [Methanobacteriaceae archaeon]